MSKVKISDNKKTVEVEGNLFVVSAIEAILHDFANGINYIEIVLHSKVKKIDYARGDRATRDEDVEILKQLVRAAN